MVSCGALFQAFEPRPRVLDVPSHLCDQFLRRGEPLLSPQAVEQVYAHLLAVDILVEIEDVRLDDRARLDVERRADADAGTGLVAVLAHVGSRDIDAVGGESAVEADGGVGRRGAERAASPRAGPTGA